MSDIMQLTDLGFDANYHIERVDRHPVGIAVHEFRRRKGSIAPDALVLETSVEKLLLEIEPFSGESWVGSFEGGLEGLTGVFATPCADAVCVVVKGQGFWVPVLTPANFEVIRSTPIKRVLPIPDRDALLFVDYTRLAAYEANGLMWQSDELSWDGLEIVDVTAGTIKGTAWDSPAGRDVAFSVDAATGKSTGGSSPTKYGVGQSARKGT